MHLSVTLRPVYSPRDESIFFLEYYASCVRYQKKKKTDDFKGCRMGRSDKVSLWYVALLTNTRFRFFILE